MIKTTKYIRVGSAVPPVHLGDPEANCAEIIKMMDLLAAEDVSLAVFPELCVTGYSCGDLFRQPLLLQGALDALYAIARYTAGRCGVVVGVPLLRGAHLYNCAVLCHGGEIKGVVPKQYLPDHNEFYEKRRFVSGAGIADDVLIIGGKEIPFGTDLLFEFPSSGAVVGLEICEDLWTTIPPSSHLCLAGANVIMNLSASNELLAKHDYLASLVCQQSARCLCGYVYASAGKGESSTDTVYAGNALIAENGRMLEQSSRFAEMPLVEIADLDLMALEADRVNSTFTDQSPKDSAFDWRTIYLSPDIFPSVAPETLRREVSPLPFVPADPSRLDERCREIVSIQAAGLEQRLRFTRCRNLVVGISGGLDSTLALLVAVKAFDTLGLPRTGICGITMPGFGTTKRTHSNASDIMRELGVTSIEIPIAAAVRQHFCDIGHDEKVTDVTYENSQARERTQILMDYANKVGGMVLGTGDLSELALGWCTYNGDHMSMYGVNTSIPKTLVRHLVAWFALRSENKRLKEALLDICDTPISPELTPADKEGNIAQKTEDFVGPYELHDFFLYYMLRYAFPPSRIFFLALKAFAGTYEDAVILKWLRTFYRRFFSQQFKRSCMPDGPKVGSVSLSPRGDWRMPSDASAALWLKEVDSLTE